MSDDPSQDSPPRPTLGYESRAAKPRRPTDATARFHRAVGRVVIVFVALPVGVGSAALGWALLDVALGNSFLHGSWFCLLAGAGGLVVGSASLGFAGFHAVRFFR